MNIEKHNHHIVIIPSLNDSCKLGMLIGQQSETEGMPAHVFKYPTREWTIDRAALMLATYVDTEIIQDDKGRSVSFVGYGTGSLIMRYFLTHYELLPARRCIIIADPRHPTDRYRKRKAGKWGHYRYGSILDQLAEGPRGFPAHCGIPPIPTGVIVSGVKREEEMDRIHNVFIEESIYTPTELLSAARDVVYIERSSRSKKSAGKLNKYVSSFLQHGWFTRE